MSGPWDKYQQQGQGQGYSQIMSELSPKDQAELKMKMQSEGRKRLADLDTSLAEAQPTISGLRDFRALNKVEPTGDIWDNVAPNWPILRGDDSNRMIAIQSRLGPGQRITGSGASSDRDVSLFMGGLPRIEQTEAVNTGIINEFEGRYKTATDKRAAMQTHLDKYGHMGGFDAEWAGIQEQQNKGSNANAPVAPTPAKQPSKSAKDLPTKAPAGVDPQTWKYLTPDERKLWTK